MSASPITQKINKPLPSPSSSVSSSLSGNSDNDEEYFSIKSNLKNDRYENLQHQQQPQQQRRRASVETKNNNNNNSSNNINSNVYKGGFDHYPYQHETMWSGFLTFLSDALSRGQFEHDEDEAKALEELHKAYEHIEKEEQEQNSNDVKGNEEEEDEGDDDDDVVVKKVPRGSIDDHHVLFHKEKINCPLDDDDDENEDENDDDMRSMIDDDDNDSVIGCGKDASPTETRKEAVLSNESVLSVVVTEKDNDERGSKSSNPIRSSSSKSRVVRFKSDVDVMVLPKSECKEASNARKGTWVAAPNMDTLWDGEERRFWERQLTKEELKQIIIERRNKQLQKFMGIVSEYFDSHVIQPGTSALHNIKSSVQTQSEFARNRDFEQLKQKFSHYESAFKDKMSELIEYQKNSIIQAGNQLLRSPVTDNQDKSAEKISVSSSSIKFELNGDGKPRGTGRSVVCKRSSIETLMKNNNHNIGRFDAAVHQDQILENRATHSPLFSDQFQVIYVIVYFVLPLTLLFMIHFGQWLVAEFVFSPHKIDWYSRVLVFIPQKVVDALWPALLHDKYIILRGLCIAVLIGVEISLLMIPFRMLKNSHMVSSAVEKFAKSLEKKPVEQPKTTKTRSWRKGSSAMQHRASSHGSIGSFHLDNASRRSRSTSSSIHSVQPEQQPQSQQNQVPLTNIISNSNSNIPQGITHDNYVQILRKQVRKE